MTPSNAVVALAAIDMGTTLVVVNPFNVEIPVTEVNPCMLRPNNLLVSLML